MKRAFPYIISVIFAGFLIYSCDDTLTASDIDNKIIPDSDVSYGEYIQPLLTVKCAMSGCHDSSTQAAGVILTSWGFVTSDYSIVAPYYPANSKLVWAIEGNGAKTMPPLGGSITPMTDNQIKGIKTWIKEGAKNN